MSDKSAIEWTDSTWNVVTGCTRVSPGCANCYIERTPPFRMQGRRFARVGTEATTGVTLHWDRLERVPTGRRIFTPSLGDLFHEDVPRDFLAETFAVMSIRDSKIFQVLTKRPEQALEILRSPVFWLEVNAARLRRGAGTLPGALADVGAEPLPNLWLGVSIENSRYTWRADVLRETPAAIRFISAEPLLGSLFERGREAAVVDTALPLEQTGSLSVPASSVLSETVGQSRSKEPLDLTGIDWVIAGGESGPGARPMDLGWVRELGNACMDRQASPLVAMSMASIGITRTRPAFFVKQLGSVWAREHKADPKGGDWDRWPEDLRVREFPT